jgi:hypothetical protein
MYLPWTLAVRRRLTPLLLLGSVQLSACPGADDDSAAADDDDSSPPADDDDSSPGPDDDDSAHGDDDDSIEYPDLYSFQSHFEAGDSVAYSGQVFRGMLIEALKSHIGGLSARLDGGWFPEEGEVVGELDFYFQFDGETSGGLPHGFTSKPAPLQGTWAEIGDADLVGKLAGNDPEGQHEDWATAFSGWPQDGITTPESLVRAWFQQLEDQALDWSNGVYPLNPDGEPVGKVHVTTAGQDLKELIQKFLVGALAFSQAADDYLDDDLPGAGLLSDNVAQVEGKPYTALEHAWDEGFGYFGAARDYGAWTDDEVAAAPYRDSFSPDGSIDLLSEYCWGISVNAAKRDLGSDPLAPTDLSAMAWDAFVAGRGMITWAGGKLGEPQMEQLQEARDFAVSAWEQTIAATVVHYVNEVLVDMGTFGSESYSFEDHAKHWSEMKGFALAFQFNPRAAIAAEDFVALHELLGTAPLLPGGGSDDEIAAYRAGLLAARAMLGEAFAFDAANLGADDGSGGW